MIHFYNDAIQLNICGCQFDSLPIFVNFERSDLIRFTDLRLIGLFLKSSENFLLFLDFTLFVKTFLTSTKQKNEKHFFSVFQLHSGFDALRRFTETKMSNMYPVISYPQGEVDRWTLSLMTCLTQFRTRGPRSVTSSLTV